MLCCGGSKFSCSGHAGASDFLDVIKSANPANGRSENSLSFDYSAEFTDTPTVIPWEKLKCTFMIGILAFFPVTLCFCCKGMFCWHFMCLIYSVLSRSLIIYSLPASTIRCKNCCPPDSCSGYSFCIPCFVRYFSFLF